MLVLLCGFLWEGVQLLDRIFSFQIFPRLPLLWILLGALILSGITWLFAQTSLARQRLGQVTVFLTAGQVIMLMQLMAALKNLDFQWTGH
jgi:heme/copper-type cytochrome/quinol oxidase subunit 3